MSSCSLSCLFVLLAVTACFADPWDAYNDPSVFSSILQYDFASLPLNAMISQTPWSDTYWPSYESGIAHRWMSPAPQDFSYATFSKGQLLSMPYQKLQILSPAEKFDILNSRYDYPTVQSEWQRTSPNDETWEGLCHGWAPASLYYLQPNPINITNKDGISIPFGSSDIKALLIWFTAEYDEGSGDSTVFIGQRCNIDIMANASAAESPSCSDLNAGTFHILMANLLAGGNSGFVMDRDRGIQVWNQPLYQYQASVISTTNTTTGKSVELSVTIKYGKERVPQWSSYPTFGITETYEYTLDLNKTGSIVGGSHITWDRPDFAWKRSPLGPFYGYFANLQTLYQASTANTTQSTKRSMRETPIPTGASKSTSHAHHELAEGKISFSLSPENKERRHTFSIARASDSSSLYLRFDNLKLQKNLQSVKVYEGTQGEGALIAVLSRNADGVSLSINCEGAFIVYTESPVAGANVEEMLPSSFFLSYRSV